MKRVKKSDKSEFRDLPRLTRDKDRAIRDMMRGILADPRVTSSSPPIPVDIFFMERDGKQMALFTMGGGQVSQHAGMQVIAALDRGTMEQIVSQGQDPIWDWLRNVAMHTCVEAVSKGLDLPNVLAVQLADVVRSVSLDDDRELRDRIYLEARELAYAKLMSGGIRGAGVTE